MLFYIIGKKFLKWLGEFEGLSLVPYACPAMKLTIGYGHCIFPREEINEFSGKFMLEAFETIKRSHRYRNEINQILQRQFPDFITKEQAISLLEKDISILYDKVNLLIKSELNIQQIQAILSFVFNIGLSSFKKSTMLKYINLGDFTRASKEFERWVYVGRRFTKGLVIRRQKEKVLFEGKYLLE